MEWADYSKMLVPIKSIKKKEAIKLQNSEYMSECDPNINEVYHI
jgi:hypothetical protein